MQKRAITGILAFILLVQPLVLTGYFSIRPATVDTGPSRDVRLAQEPGIRLEPEDLTDHVPIFINGTDDFVIQGWPGSGSEPDPFIIEALNITYNIGEVGIHIINTDAHFVIRDCYVNQMSNELAVGLHNVSNGIVEYCSIISEAGGVEAFDTTNTEIMHCDVLATQNAVYFNASSESTVSWNRLNSTARRALTCEYCTDLTLSHNTLAGDSPSWYTAVVRYSNHTTVT
ncbi:right-handed parallel beta-helix repeat-containing protein, partial [Candidatus Thorarchaeota archaeon]